MRSSLQTALGTIPALRKHPDDESALLTRMAVPLLRSRRLQIGGARLDVPDSYRPYELQIRRSKSVDAHAWLRNFLLLQRSLRLLGDEHSCSDDGCVKR
jgi:hypothetical protein